MDVGRKEILQCQCCGGLHKEDIRGHTIIDEMYVTMKCKKCKEITSHLLCGTEDIDIYLTYNLNVDPRYF